MLFYVKQIINRNKLRSVIEIQSETNLQNKMYVISAYLNIRCSFVHTFINSLTCSRETFTHFPSVLLFYMNHLHTI